MKFSHQPTTANTSDMAKKEAKQKTFFLFDKKLYVEKEFDGLYTAGEQLEIEERVSPFQWNGGLIPMEIHRKIISFFFDGYKKTNSENLIWLYYDIDTREWLAWAPPQECNGMTVSAETKNKDYQEQRKTIEERFVLLGTYHHHCKGNAFASGTDKDDECDRDGIHVTIGGIGQSEKELTIHCRAVFKGQEYPTRIENWVSGPHWLDQVPEIIQHKVYWSLLTLPAKDMEYSEQWLENAKKKQWSAPVIGGYPNATQQQFNQMAYHQGHGRKTTTTNTGKSSTEQAASGEVNSLIKEAIGIIAEDKFLDYPKPKLVEEKDIISLIQVLLSISMDADEAESLVTDPRQDQFTFNEAALYELLVDTCRKMFLFPGRLKHLFFNFPIAEYYDMTQELAADRHTKS